jgi:hypothetical protein
MQIKSKQINVVKKVSYEIETGRDDFPIIIYTDYYNNNDEIVDTVVTDEYDIDIEDYVDLTEIQRVVDDYDGV